MTAQPYSANIVPNIQPICESGEIQAAIDELHDKYRCLQVGAIANYIPELAKMNPDWFSSDGSNFS